MATNSFTYLLTEPEKSRLSQLLQADAYTPTEVPHTIVSVEGPSCRIQLYRSGKLLVQGKGAQDWVLYTLEPQVLQRVEVGYEKVLNPERSSPHMGIDESGKGDYFGPLVIASAYVDAGITEAFDEMGVRDSKRITSDQKAIRLAADIRSVLGNRFSMVCIGPNTYNRLYEKMGNVNKLLAWGHARAIENLLEKIPDCPRAIADQFGPEQRIRSALMNRGKNIELIQRTKAESDPAVAAASILARAAFLQALSKAGDELDLTLPKGASSAVIQAAQELVRRKGPVRLRSYAKLHFRTTQTVLESDRP